MSDQGTKVLPVVDTVEACREAPASHGQNWEQGKTLPVDVGKIKDYNEDREINIGRCQKWEDGKARGNDAQSNLQRQANKTEACLCEFLQLTKDQQKEIIQYARSFLAKNASSQ